MVYVSGTFNHFVGPGAIISQPDMHGALLRESDAITQCSRRSFRRHRLRRQRFVHVGGEDHSTGAIGFDGLPPEPDTSDIVHSLVVLNDVVCIGWSIHQVGGQARRARGAREWRSDALDPQVVGDVARATRMGA